MQRAASMTLNCGGVMQSSNCGDGIVAIPGEEDALSTWNGDHGGVYKVAFSDDGKDPLPKKNKLDLQRGD